jgi:formylglycine-generating enzyme required for sulfatase activity
VAYAYQIGKYEVTNAQYGEFLNAVDPSGANANSVYNAYLSSDVRRGITYNAGAVDGAKYTIRTNMGDKPVNYVSWYDAARFTNWLYNGQGSGSTETGAYTLTGNTGLITKNPGATVYLPSENEWYKAAYYDPTPGAGGGDNYWAYPTQSDTAPTVGTANSTGVISNPGVNVVNYGSGAVWNGQTGNVTTVGSAAANNYFGTADQAGNVWEWTDATGARALRAGAWINDANILAASYRDFDTGTFENANGGFRVASVVASVPVPVPEPSAFLVSVLLVSAVLIRRRRSTR